MVRRLAAALAVALVAAASLWGRSVPAYAHALLVSSTPHDGATVDAAPAEMLLTFSEVPDPVLSGVTLVDASGKRVEGARAEPVPGQPQMRVSLTPLAQGTYTVTWRVTSVVDGHTTVGALAFGVGVPAVPVGNAEAQAEVQDSSPTVASVAGRWLFYLGVVLLLGAAVVGATVVSDPATISRRVLGAAWVLAAAGLVFTVADYRAATRSTVADVLSSPTGQKLTTQAVAVAIAGAAVAWACLRPGRSPLVAVGLGASLTMLARALAGHANASSPRWFTVGTHWAHLVSVGAWVGGLFWLLAALRRRDPGRPPGLARRFSTVAGGTLAVVAVSGVLRALDEVGAWRRLVDTTFGITLLVKIGFVVALVAVAARSRFRHVRRAPASGGPGLRRTVRGEVALATGVLGATAVLAGLPPSASVAAADKAAPSAVVAATGNDYATSVRMRLTVTPGAPGANRFESTVEDYDSGDPVPADSVSLRFRLDGRPDVPAATVDLVREGDSRWRGAGSALSIEGRWTVTGLVQTASDAVEVPMEVDIRPRAASAATSGGDATCGRGEQDPSYSMTVRSEPEPPTAEGTVFRLSLRQDGKPVSGAKVCMKVDMPEMQHPGVSRTATERSPGEYEATLTFSMTGGWQGSVSIAEPGKRSVVVPIRFEVR